MPVFRVESTVSGRTITANDPIELLEKINNIEPANDREERFFQFITDRCLKAIAVTKYLLAIGNN